MKWFILFSGVLSNASASILIKIAMTPPRKIPSLEDPIGTLMNWPLWLGLALYGVAFILYAVSLSLLPLNVAHPILTSGAIALVALYSFLILQEDFSLLTWIGILLIVAGVIAITTSHS